MKRIQFNYDCPSHLIAQEPTSQRDASRLLVFSPMNGVIDSMFIELPMILNQNFSLTEKNKKLLLIGNNSKVYPARVKVFRATGARCEVFVLEVGKKNEYACLIKPKSKLKQDEILYLDQNQKLPVFQLCDFENSKIKPLFSESMIEFLEKHGSTPLPPYIKRVDPAVKPRDDKCVGPAVKPRDDKCVDPAVKPRDGNQTVSSRGLTAGPSLHNDKSRYQNVYADAKNLGSSAAPTAGFHFSDDLISELSKYNIDIDYITLHVGLGTFLPVKADDITDHLMHEENYYINSHLIRKIFHFIQNEWPIVFIGTTSLRAIESFFREVQKTTNADPRYDIEKSLFQSLKLADKWHTTNLFLYPQDETGHQLPIVGDALITNFHQPESSLLMLVASIIGFQNLKIIYNHALNQQYRFFSYGDSSLLIFPKK